MVAALRDLTFGYGVVLVLLWMVHLTPTPGKAQIQVNSVPHCLLVNLELLESRLVLVEGSDSTLGFGHLTKSSSRFLLWPPLPGVSRDPTFLACWTCRMVRTSTPTIWAMSFWLNWASRRSWILCPLACCSVIFDLIKVVLGSNLFERRTMFTKQQFWWNEWFGHKIQICWPDFFASAPSMCLNSGWTSDKVAGKLFRKKSLPQLTLIYGRTIYSYFLEAQWHHSKTWPRSLRTALCLTRMQRLSIESESTTKAKSEMF